MPSLLIRNATILTMNDRWETIEGAVSIHDGRIAAIGSESQLAGHHDRTLDAAGGYLLPGFIQTHVHLCQTLFRGLADDLPLLDWLSRRVWPLEAAHDPVSLRVATRLASFELLRTGTTAVLTMETVHHTDVVFETLAETGLRATVGKCMMDMPDPQVPAPLREETRRSIDESVAIGKRWHGAAGGRLRAAYAPRFALSCTRELLEEVGALAAHGDVLVHTHASESRHEVAIVRDRWGLSNVAYLAEAGLASPRLCAAHCVWVDQEEQALMAERAVKVLHCPGSNLKLGSGIAPLVEMLARGICVSLGADGAACNNHLDMLDEMRLAATLQAVRLGPGALSARQALWMATRNGARTLGLDHDIGSIEVGKRADLIVIDRDRPHLLPGDDPYSTIVYAARGSDVRSVLVDGEVLVDAFVPTRFDAVDLAVEARAATRALVARAGI